MAHQIPPNMPKYIGTQDPIEFLQLYTTSVHVAGGAVNVMANWLPLARNGVAQSWLMNLPQHL